MDGTLALKKYNVEERLEALEKGGGGGGYVLPVASAETLGGVKVGDNLSIDENGVLSAEGGGSSMHTYSMSEQEVAIWIDGSTLYEKTFVCKKAGVDQLTYTNSSYAIDVLNMADAFVYGVMARRTAQYQSKYIDCYNVTGEIQTVIDTTGAIYFPYAARFDDIIVTLRYTKTAESKKRSKK